MIQPSNTWRSGLGNYRPDFCLKTNSDLMNPDDISKLAFLLYPHIVKAPPDDTTVEYLAERVRQLQTGLLPEDEFRSDEPRRHLEAGVLAVSSHRQGTTR